MVRQGVAIMAICHARTSVYVLLAPTVHFAFGLSSIAADGRPSKEFPLGNA